MLVRCGGHAPSASSAPPAGELFGRAKALYEDRKWEKAKAAFEGVIFSYPGAAFVDTAQYYLAACSYNLKDYITAADEYRRLHARYPNSPLVDDGDLNRCRALLKIAPGNATLDQEKTQDAITEISLFKDNYPLSELLPSIDSLMADAQGRLSRRDFRAAVLYQRLGRYEAARIYFQQVIDNHTESPYVPDCLFYMAEGYRHQDSTDRAIEYYQKMLYLYPQSERAEDAKKRAATLSQHRDTVRAEE
jgi:outer membrane protein assembly factor BamD